MTDYTIHGEYPDYTITVDGGQVDSMSDFATVMRWFIARMQPGDSITWEPSSAEPATDDATADVTFTDQTRRAAAAATRAND